MNLISLITDFGLNDNFVGVMRAVILSINPEAKIIDICHNVRPQDIFDAAFLLKSSFGFFPKGTVHLIVVDPGVGSERKKILVKTKDYFFVGPDNGVLDLALKGTRPEKIIEIDNDKYFLKPTSDTFHGRDIFAPVVAYLSRGERIERFGKEIAFLKSLELPQAKISANNMTGEVIYIDRFGNLITNIDKETLYNFIKIKDSTFQIQIKDTKIDKLSNNYSEVTKLAPLALIDSFGYLEVAVSQGNAKDFFGVGKGQAVQITKI